MNDTCAKKEAANEMADTFILFLFSFFCPIFPPLFSFLLIMAQTRKKKAASKKKKKKRIYGR